MSEKITAEWLDGCTTSLADAAEYKEPLMDAWIPDIQRLLDVGRAALGVDTAWLEYRVSAASDYHSVTHEKYEALTEAMDQLYVVLQGDDDEEKEA